MAVERLPIAHEHEVLWLIALWLSIHGGDPPPEELMIEIDEATMSAGSAFVSGLQQLEQTGAVEYGEIDRRLATFGITAREYRVEELNSDDLSLPDSPPDGCRRVCFRLSHGIRCFIICPLPREPGP